jgi:hypothetical protein
VEKMYLAGDAIEIFATIFPGTITSGDQWKSVCKGDRTR